MCSIVNKPDGAQQLTQRAADDVAGFSPCPRRIMRSVTRTSCLRAARHLGPRIDGHACNTSTRTRALGLSRLPRALWRQRWHDGAILHLVETVRRGVLQCQRRGHYFVEVQVDTRLLGKLGHERRRQHGTIQEVIGAQAETHSKPFNLITETDLLPACCDVRRGTSTNQRCLDLPRRTKCVLKCLVSSTTAQYHGTTLNQEKNAH